MHLEIEQWKTLSRKIAKALRVSGIGIIQSFDSVAQTVTVQLAITESVLVNFVPTPIKIPLLLDVPILVPCAGGYAVTLPVEKGDECLVVFTDSDYGAWWAQGGVQNEMFTRRHNLSDGIAILGVKSQPNVLTNYSVSSLQVRSNDGTTYIDVANGQITITDNVVITNGASGTFTTPTGQIVTVQNGIITNIN